jgi:hypothetical protein
MKKFVSLRRAFATILLAGLVTIRLTSPIAAQEQVPGSGLQISPTRHELSVDAGTKKTVTISLKNVSGAKVNAKAIINDFESDDATGTPKLLTKAGQSSPASIKKLVTNLEDVPLDKDQVKDIAVTIAVPANASPGAYYGVIRFQAVPVDADNDGNVSLTASVGTIMLIEVPGEIRESMEVLSIKAEKGGKSSFFFTSAPDKMAVQVKNTGNSFLKPFGKVTITKGSKEIYSYELNNTDPRGNVLPDSTRTFRDDIKNIGGFGRYKAVANLGFGDGGEVVTVNATFWLIPLWLLVVIIALLVGLVLGIVMITLKLRKHRHGFRKR